MKPIIFSTSGVQALLNTKPGTWPAEPIDPGRSCKSQTRRVIKPQPEHSQYHEYKGKPVHESEYRMWCFKDFVVPDEYIPNSQGNLQTDMSPLCKYARYQVGDRLWVRETFYDGDMQGNMIYRADGKYDCDGVWKPSIHMPRHAARLFLEVKEVRVERLQDISPHDACCEGVLVELPEPLQRRQAGLPPEIPESWKWETKTPEQRDEVALGYARAIYMQELFVLKTLIQKYEELWNAINGKGAWESNPWVWVYEFMRVEG